MDIQKTIIKEGYVAYNSIDHSQALCIIFGGMGYENRFTLTKDPDLVYVCNDKKVLEMYCKQYNDKHKNKIEFDIVEGKFALVTKFTKIS